MLVLFCIIIWKSRFFIFSIFRNFLLISIMGYHPINLILLLSCCQHLWKIWNLYRNCHFVIPILGLLNILSFWFVFHWLSFYFTNLLAWLQLVLLIIVGFVCFFMSLLSYIFYSSHFSDNIALTRFWVRFRVWQLLLLIISICFWALIRFSLTLLWYFSLLFRTNFFLIIYFFEWLEQLLNLWLMISRMNNDWNFLTFLRAIIIIIVGLN